MIVVNYKEMEKVLQKRYNYEYVDVDEYLEEVDTDRCINGKSLLDGFCHEDRYGNEIYLDDFEVVSPAVYRLYNELTGETVETTDFNEYSEADGWYYDCEVEEAVYRFLGRA